MLNLESCYKKVYFYFLVLEFILFPVMFFPVSETIVLVSIFSVFLVGALTLYHTIKLHKAIPGRARLFGLIVGIFFILGGSVFDMAATIICSPDLSEEGNPVLVALLDYNFSLHFIYLFTLFYQILKVSIHLYLWCVFLKVYPKILKKIPYKNLFTTIRWLSGSAKANFIQVLLNKNLQYEILVPTIGFVVFALNYIHWYAGMEWLELIPYGPEAFVLGLWGIFFSFLLLAVLTHLKIRKNSYI